MPRGNPAAAQQKTPADKGQKLKTVGSRWETQKANQFTIARELERRGGKIESRSAPLADKQVTQILNMHQIEFCHEIIRKLEKDPSKTIEKAIMETSKMKIPKN